MKGVLGKRDIKTMQTRIKMYFKPILTYNADIWTLTKRNESKMQSWMWNVLRKKQEGIELEMQVIEKRLEELKIC